MADWLIVYRKIAHVCSRAGLRPDDVDDLAQDVVEWLVRANKVQLAAEAAWLNSVVRHFLQRYWRRKYRTDCRESMTLQEVSDPLTEHLADLYENRELLDRLSTLLPSKEARLLSLIRTGYSFTEAAHALGIPDGSFAYVKARLLRNARIALISSGDHVTVPSRRSARTTESGLPTNGGVSSSRRRRGLSSLR